jgi:outer membrane protein OmpA-like peptidoglycan-associated protein
MRTHASGILLAVTLAGLTVSACATEDYVDQHIAVVNTRIDGLSAKVDELAGRVSALDGRIATAGNAAMARADAAYALAEGKFVTTEVGREEVNFATGSSALSTEAEATLTALADRLKAANKNVFLEIQGHADPRGGKQFNRELGRERAGEVGRFLHQHGVSGNHMQLGSWGEDQPKADAKTAEANAANRRVVIVVLQ